MLDGGWWMVDGWHLPGDWTPGLGDLDFASLGNSPYKIFFFLKWGAFRPISPHPRRATRVRAALCEAALGRYAVQGAPGAGDYSTRVRHYSFRVGRHSSPSGRRRCAKLPPGVLRIFDGRGKNRRRPKLSPRVLGAFDEFNDVRARSGSAASRSGGRLGFEMSKNMVWTGV
jgi:hypothetical protein